MKKLVLFVLPLIAAALLFSGMGKKPVAEESSVCAPMAKCECVKDCKACGKGMANCGKDGCTCMKADMKGAKCADCKGCTADKKNCGKEGCTCIKMDKKGKKGMKCGDCKGCGTDKKNCGKEGCTCKKGENKEKGVKPEKKGKEGKAESASGLSVRKPTKEELGKEVTCPVMTNEKFKVSVATPVIDYKGKAYFMCCKGCPQKFMATPEKYIK